MAILPGPLENQPGRVQAFDAIIVGAGQAGVPMAARLTAAGKRVAIVERKLFGGTCVNVGCTPTKAMVASAYVARLAVRAAEFGVRLSSPPQIDFAAVMARKDAIVQQHRIGVENFLDRLENCTVKRGQACFVGPAQLQVGDEQITAPKIFLNVGGRPATPDLPGLDQIKFLTSSGILALKQLPKHLVVVGASYIGLEFAQMFRRFGAEVTVIEKSSRLIGREDERVSVEIKTILEREGVVFRLGAECISFAAHKAGAAVFVDCREGDNRIVGSHVLIAVGRRPNTDDLGLEAAGVKMDANGYIVVDDQLQTSAKGVFALGDCNGRGAFTHTAWNDFEIVAANLLAGEARSVADRIPVYALFIDPPLGRVGMTEAQGRAEGRKVRTGYRSMVHVARAVEKGEAQGLMSVVIDAETDQILGAAVLGPGGDEVVHGFLQTMAAKAPYTTLAQTMPIHPTVSELLPTLLGELSPAS
jgi:pyruvate/2-oxoglutarate dehydrogenase complex dihydrolipoamide dehydrogenase (E3) component